MAPVIEVLIGLILVYTILSIVVSSVQEGLAGIFGWRSTYLEKGITSLLGVTLSGRFFKHDVIRALSNDSGLRFNRSPSYISASTFTETILDVVRRVQPPEGANLPSGPPDVASKDKVLSDLRTRLPRPSAESASQVPSDEKPPIYGALRIFSSAADDLEDFKKRLDGWYEETMDRVRGWYTRFTRLVLFLIGVVLVILVNADSINIATTLWREAPIRTAVVEQASTVAEDEEPNTEQAVERLRKLEELNLPLGWVLQDPSGNDPRGLPSSLRGIVTKLLGLLITAAALSFGSTFWFDLLKRFVGIRASGPEPQPAQTGPPSGAAEQPLRLDIAGVQGATPEGKPNE